MAAKLVSRNNDQHTHLQESDEDDEESSNNKWDKIFRKYDDLLDENFKESMRKERELSLTSEPLDLFQASEVNVTPEIPKKHPRLEDNSKESMGKECQEIILENNEIDETSESMGETYKLDETSESMGETYEIYEMSACMGEKKQLIKQIGTSGINYKYAVRTSSTISAEPNIKEPNDKCREYLDMVETESTNIYLEICRIKRGTCFPPPDENPEITDEVIKTKLNEEIEKLKYDSKVSCADCSKAIISCAHCSKAIGSCADCSKAITCADSSKTITSYDCSKAISCVNCFEAIQSCADCFKAIRSCTDCSKAITSCADCSTPKRVEDMKELKKGQHIDMPGKYLSGFVNILGEQISAYRHHAIVKEVFVVTNYTGKVTLIDFHNKDKKIKVCKHTDDINLRANELNIIEYKYPRYDPDTIVERAEGLLKESNNGEFNKRYNLLTNNCEHFATWCVTGKGTSLQVRAFLSEVKEIISSIFGPYSWLAQLILKHFEIDSFFTSAFKAAQIRVWLSVNIIYNVIRTVYLIKQYRDVKTICWHCLKQKLLDIWLQFAAYGMKSVINLAIVHFVLPLLSSGASIPITLVLDIIGSILTVTIPRIRRALWSPVEYSTREIKNLSEIKVGDVLSLKYYRFAHLAVVSDVHMDQNPEKDKIQGIHYSLPTCFGTRRIAEEFLQTGLKTINVSLVDFHMDNESRYSPQEVVDRARKRIGEEKWNMLSNRSDHFCSWAVKKIKYFKGIKCSEDEHTKLLQPGSSLLVGKADVHLMDEIKDGDVVECKSYKGIIVKLKNIRDKREFRMHIVIRKGYFNYYGGKVKLSINLNKDYLTVYRYHPVHCVSKSQRAERAKGIVGKTIQRWTETDFIEDIILNHSEIKTFSDIKVGDVVSLTYYSFAHPVVVSEVHPEKGEIQGIHYSLKKPTLFDTRTIEEETFQIELERFKVSRVYLKTECTYPPEKVVDRARKRLGEQKWNISSNTSEHLCRWAKEKLDNNSAQSKDMEDNETNSTQSGNLSSLLVGKADIHLMNEIEPGDVVEYKSYKGIIVKLKNIRDGREFRMHLVIRKGYFNYYGGKVKLSINLNKDCLTVYRYNSVHCVSKSVRVKKAVSMIDKRIQRWTQTGFIEDIILNHSEIKTISEIKVGDVVSLTYYGFAHPVVVSEVHTDPNPEKGEIQGIHYSLPTLFGTRTIVEETFQIELERFKVNRVYFKTECTYPPLEVVDRARKRLGERKWNISSNTSEHFCRWAKEILDNNSAQIKDIEDKETNPTNLVGKADIHLMDEIEPGDVVEYKSYKGIIVKLKDEKDGREFYMHIVVCRSWLNYYVEKLELRIDLNKDCLTVYRYHPVHCVIKNQRVKRAKRMVGKKIQRWTQTGFIEDIILIAK